MKTQAENLCLALCLGLMAAACISLLPSCASKRQSQSSDEYTDDKSLRLRVSTALSDNPDYKFDGVSVNVSKGVAELGGLVDVFSQKVKAYDIARLVPGIKDVQDNITVKEQIAANTGESVDDTSLTANVKSALDDNPGYTYAEVTVQTFRGAVQLSGFVNTVDQKNKAGVIAREVSGVREVLNNITVKDKM